MSKKLIYNFGSKFGFFSEYNNMILCYLYCLCNDIDFVLFDSNSRFSNQNDWMEFFVPFCPIDSHKFNKRYNKRDYFGDMSWGSIIKDIFCIKTNRANLMQRLKYRICGDIYKYVYNFDYYTYELFATARNQECENIYNCEKLGIKDDLQTLCKELVRRTWVYNTKTQVKIKQYIHKVPLPEKYLGLHIRGGDKFLEYEIQNVEKYMSILEKKSFLRTVFLLTDDYRIFLRLQEQYPNWTFYTLCSDDELGYYHDEYMLTNSKEKIKEQHIKLFASVDILASSDFFVGTYSSNPGMYLGMRMDKGKTTGVDFENWRIW